jgi:hypothetical protein
VHFGFGGNVTASSDKSDQKLSGNDFIKSFSLHQLKKADKNDTLNASYANTKVLVARLNSFLNAIEIVLQNIRSERDGL